MSREIKFRAWIEENKTMERGLFGLRSDGKVSFNKDCVLMRFIGEKDKNKTEIYENDIVEVCVFMVSPSNTDDDHHFRGNVFFENGAWQIEVFKQMSYHTDGKWNKLDWKCGLDRDSIDGNGIITMPLHNLMAMSGNLGEFNEENIEVIGNAFENPELINQ